MRRPLLNHTAPGDAVYDPFLGSGTALIAAETTGRICLAVELDPRYVDVAIRRWQAFTGAKATLLADGRTFDDIAHVRLSGATRAEPCGQSATPADMAVRESKAREGRKASTSNNRSATCASARTGTSEPPRKRGANQSGVEPKRSAATAPASSPRGTAGDS
jgi:hypothetical protein